MGQAQLLLIVLGVVIVGLAVMAGINAYSQNNIKADLDAVVNDCVRLASDAQLYAQKPTQFGGLATVADPFETEGMTIDGLGWDATNGTQYSTLALTAGDASAVFTCTSKKFPAGTTANATTATVTGPLDTNIAITTTQYAP